MSKWADGKFHTESTLNKFFNNDVKKAPVEGRSAGQDFEQSLRNEIGIAELGLKTAEGTVSRLCNYSKSEDLSNGVMVLAKVRQEFKDAAESLNANVKANSKDDFNPPENSSLPSPG